MNVQNYKKKPRDFTEGHKRSDKMENTYKAIR